MSRLFSKGIIVGALREASVTMLACIATLLCTLPIEGGLGPAVLGVVLCLALSRSQLVRRRHGGIEAAVALPVVGLVAVGVGVLLHRVPWLGAAVFVAGMYLSIWLRRFGPMARRFGSLIALPFIALLATPYIPPAPDSRIPSAFIPVVVSLLAVLWVSVTDLLARRVRFLPPAREPSHREAVPAGEGSLRPIASTRMAIQMAVALSVSFLIGYVYFPERWGWIVLTAFIVLSGNRGRVDVAYKSVLRLLGAAVGTVLAMSITSGMGSDDCTTVVLLLGALFLGLWLRPLGYAWWALFVTLALALLQGFAGASAPHHLWLRLEEILFGAIIGVASAWFVLPVRSAAVIRRRIATALTALSDALDPANPVRIPDDFVAAVDGVEQLAPPFRASRLLRRYFRAPQPAEWVDTLVACREPAVALIAQGKAPGTVRRAVGAARKALRTPTEIQPALEELRVSLIE
jgi:hypothetical protein